VVKRAPRQVGTVTRRSEASRRRRAMRPYHADGPFGVVAVDPARGSVTMGTIPRGTPLWKPPDRCPFAPLERVPEAATLAPGIWR